MTPYFKQEKSYTCSVAVLRMVLAGHDIFVSETELWGKLVQDYGQKTKNVLNEKIALLANEFGLQTEVFQWNRNLEQRLIELIADDAIVMISVKLQRLYPEKKGLHTLLLYGYQDQLFYYHDPAFGASLTISFAQLQAAGKNVGSIILFR